MCLQRVTICSECKKETDGLITCTYVDGEEIHLCPDCLKADGSYCLSCGCFCSGIESFDFIHPGYCDNCWYEIESSIRWDEEEEEDEWNEHDEYHNAAKVQDDEEYDPFPDDDSEDEFRNGSLDY